MMRIIDGELPTPSKQRMTAGDWLFYLVLLGGFVSAVTVCVLCLRAEVVFQSGQRRLKCPTGYVLTLQYERQPQALCEPGVLPSENGEAP